MIGLRAAEYFPRLRYLALVDRADRFVVADAWRYSRQSFQNRARLRTPGGQQWITIPLEGGQHGRPASAVRIDNAEPWLRKHWRSFEYNYRSAPYFDYYAHHFAGFFAGTWAHLADATTASIRILAGAYGIGTPIERLSALAPGAGTWAAAVATLGEGRLLVPADDPHAADDPPPATLAFEHPSYRQNFEGFQPEQSAVDLLFNHGPRALDLLRASARVCR